MADNNNFEIIDNNTSEIVSNDIQKIESDEIPAVDNGVDIDNNTSEVVSNDIQEIESDEIPVVDNVEDIVENKERVDLLKYDASISTNSLQDIIEVQIQKLYNVNIYHSRYIWDKGGDEIIGFEFTIRNKIGNLAKVPLGNLQVRKLFGLYLEEKGYKLLNLDLKAFNYSYSVIPSAPIVKKEAPIVEEEAPVVEEENRKFVILKKEKELDEVRDKKIKAALAAGVSGLVLIGSIIAYQLNPNDILNFLGAEGFDPNSVTVLLDTGFVFSSFSAGISGIVAYFRSKYEKELKGRLEDYKNNSYDNYESSVDYELDDIGGNSRAK